MCHADTDMPTHTATCIPRDTQADSPRTGTAGHTHMGTREEARCHCTGEFRRVGHTHGDQPMHIPRHRSRGDALIHNKEESYHPHRKSHYRLHA